MFKNVRNNTEKNNELAEKDNEFAKKDSALAEKDFEIERLRALLRGAEDANG